MTSRHGIFAVVRKWLPWLYLVFSTPLMANKFETIGSGVQGSSQIKIEYLQIIAYAAGGIFLIAGILAIVLHNSNAQTLNYTMWKYSAGLFFLLSIASVAAGLFMH
ncbi:MAG: hypothetical protein ABW068_16330 [Candidatus Thiodiazotropha sp.]